MFTLDVRSQPDYLLLCASGELDLHSRDAFRQRLKELIQESPQPIVLDLSGLEFIDSSGLGVLLSTLRVPEERRPRVVLAQTNGPVRRLLHTTRLDLLLDVRTSVEAALQPRPVVGSAA